MNHPIFNITSTANDEDVTMNLIVEQNNPNFVREKNQFIELADLFEKEIETKGYSQLNGLITPFISDFKQCIEVCTEESIIQGIGIYLLLISTYQPEKYFGVDYPKMYEQILSSIKKLKKKLNANNRI